MDLAKADFAQQESEKGWKTALAVIGKVAFSLATGGSNLGNSNLGLGADIHAESGIGHVQYEHDAAA